MYEGYKHRSDVEMERIAWHAANLMNVHLKKNSRVSVDQLLGKNKRKSMTQEERSAGIEKLRKLTGSR